MNKNWLIFLTIWILILLIGPFTLLRDFPLSFAFKDSFTTVNFFQRFVSLILFNLVFSQIILGSMMEKWTELLTGKILYFHITEGIVAYTLMIVHPVLGAINGISILPIFTSNQLFYNFGRLAFVFFTIAVFAGLFRTKSFMVKNWRKFHILNYFAFYLIAVHSYFSGSDTRNFPFIIFWWIALLIVSIIVTLKMRHLLAKSSLQNNQ